MLVVGLTGGIATGKSTVSNLLKTQSIPIIDADVLARQVVEPGTPALAKITKVFGSSVIFPDGTLDRKKLGSIIFADEAKRKQLNAIVHPAVRRAMLWQVVRCWMRGERWCVVDVPLLIEGPLWKYVGLIVVVYCSPEIQLHRLMQRDNSTHSEASARLSSQLPISSKLDYADVVIDNSTSREELEHQVITFIRQMSTRTRSGSGTAWWLLCWLNPLTGALLALWIVASRQIAFTLKQRRNPKRK